MESNSLRGMDLCFMGVVFFHKSLKVLSIIEFDL